MSYLRLQQICKTLNELIRSSSQVKGIRLDERLYWEWEWENQQKTINGFVSFFPVRNEDPKWTLHGGIAVHPDCLYGLRFLSIIPRLR